MSLFSKIRHFTTKLIMNWLNPEPEQQQTGTQITKPSSDDHIKVVYGEQKIAGTIVFYNTTNPDDGDDVKNDLLHIIVVWCEGGIESIDDILLNDISINDSKFNAKNGGRWVGAAHFTNGMGSYSDPHLKAAGWDAATKDHRLDGLACSYIRLEWSIGDDAPFTGVPDLNAVIRGRKVKNLETGVTEYSVNPAYCTLDYLTNPIFGKNLSASEYDLDSFKTAGLVAKTQVPEYQGAPTTKPLFTCNLVIDTSASLLDNVELLGKSMRALMPIINGRLTLIIEQDEEPTEYGLSERDFKGSLKYDDGGKDKRYNRVIVEYIDKELSYSDQDAIYPEPDSELADQWLAEDNGVLLEYRFKISSCNNYYEARQMARIIAMISRESLNFNVLCAPIAMRYTVADVVPISHNKLGWDKKPFRLIKSVQQSTGQFLLTFREHQPYIYNWLSGVVRPPIPDTSLPDPRNVAAPVNFTSVLLNDGNVQINWESVYSHFDIQIYKNGTLLSTTTSVTPSFIISTLDAGNYEIDVRAASKIGFRSQWVSFGFTVALPGVPVVNIDAVTYNTITLSASVTGASLGTTFEWQFLGQTAEPIDAPNTASGYNYIYTGLVPDTEYSFKVRTKNLSGVSPWVSVAVKTSLSDLLDYIDDIPLQKLSEDAQTLIEDINTQVDRLRPENENNLPSLIAKNIDAITGLSEKVQVLDAENPTGIPFKIDQLVGIVDVINAENPNNLQSQLANSNSKITDLEQVTKVLDSSNSQSLPALIKVNNIAIEKERLARQNIELAVLNTSAAYTNWRQEYERRQAKGERLIDAAVYIDQETGTIVNRAYAIADEAFNSATLLIDGVTSKITLASQQIASSQTRISNAEAQLTVQQAQINQKATFEQIDSQIAGALAALQPAYSWQFNSGDEGFNAQSHNAQGYIVATGAVTTPAIDYNAEENPMFRLRVRKHAGAQWLGQILFNNSGSAITISEPLTDQWETISVDATGANGYTGTITSLQFNLGPCDIDFIEVGKRGANDLALSDITARTTEIEQDINAATGIMAQYATTTWVNAFGFQTQSNVQTLIDTFNNTYSVAATLQELSDQNVIVKANAAQTWIDGAAATIRDQVTSILNSAEGVNERIAQAEQTIDAVSGQIQSSVSQIQGLALDVKEQGLNDILAAYNDLMLEQDLATQGVKLASATQNLSAVSNEVASIAAQTLELAALEGQNSAYLTSLNNAFANEKTARTTSERKLTASIETQSTQAVAQANERLAAVVGYCVDENGERVDEPDAMACLAAGHDWVDGPLVQLINDYTAVFVNNKGYQTAANVQQFISTFDGEYGVSATLQQINDQGIIEAAKNAQQWINAADGTITDLITQFVNKPEGINESIALAEQQILANADDIENEATARQQLSVRMGDAEADLITLDSTLANEQQVRASQGTQLRVEFQTQDLAMLATANEFTRVVTGYCVDENGDRVDQDSATQCELDGHNWVDGPSVERAINLSAAYVDSNGYQTQSNVKQTLDTFNSTYKVSATLQQINEQGVIEAAKNAEQWINAADGTITDLITQFVNKPEGINESIAFAEQQILANADDIENEATARQQLSVRMGDAEADLVSLDEAVVNEQQARASQGTQLRVEFQTQDLAMLATANEFTRVVTGYCVDENGDRVDQDSATQCELDGHNWVDGPSVERAINLSAAYVDSKGYQTQSNVNQTLDTFNSTYKVSATLQELNDNDTLAKANTAQQFINGAQAYIQNSITAFNNKEGGVNAQFSNVDEKLDAINGTISQNIVQVRGLELDLQSANLNDVLTAANQFLQNNALTKQSVNLALAQNELQAKTSELESTASQTLELAALFNNSQSQITVLNKVVASEKQASAVRDERYLATFGEVSARFSDVTTAIATINEANTVRDQEFESFVADTISSFDEVTETFASQNQAFTTLEQTLTSKIGTDTDNAKNEAIATAQEYTRTAVGYCVDKDGNISSENDAVKCVTAGGSWVDGPLAEYIANMQISDGDQTASIKQLRQLFKTVDGKLIARGGWTLDNNGRVTGIAGYNDGDIASLDFIGDVIRQGAMVGNTFVPTSYVDNTDPSNPQHVIKGRLVLGDGHTVSNLDDIKAQDGQNGKNGSFVSEIYHSTTNTNLAAPSGGAFNGTTETIPTNWQKTPYFVEGRITYVSKVQYIHNGTNWTRGAWSIPSPYIIKGDKGDQGDTPTIITNADGSYTITNGADTITIKDGLNGDDAPIPTVTDNGNGTHTVTDGAGNSIVVRDGENGYTPIKGTDYFDGNDGSFVSFIYHSTTNTNLAAPSGGSFNGTTETIPTNWQDAPYFVAGRITYVSKARYVHNGTNWVRGAWSVPAEYIIKGDKGDKGDTPTIITNADGSYTITNGADTITIKDGLNGDDAPIPTVTDNGNGTHTVTDGAGNSIVVRDGENGYTPIKGTDYFDGNDGSFVSFIYHSTTNTNLAAPSGGSFNGTTETIPTNWQDAPYFVAGRITYVSKARYVHNGTSWVRGAWSTPAEYIIKGDDGQTGTRGSIELQIGNTNGVWYDSLANSSVPNGVPVTHDRVTIYKNSDPKVQTTKRFNGTSWVAYTLYVHGSALIEDTLDANVIRAGTKMTAPIIEGGQIKGGDIEGVTITGGEINGVTGSFKGTIYAENMEGDVTDSLVKRVNQRSFPANTTPSTLVSFYVSAASFDRAVVIHPITFSMEIFNNDPILHLLRVGIAFSESGTLDDSFESSQTRDQNTFKDVTTTPLYAHIPKNTSKTIYLRLQRAGGNINTRGFVKEQSVLCQVFKQGGAIS